MTRLRKSSRIWSDPASRDDARRVTIEPGPELFAIDLAEIFGRRAPVEIELGAGKGEFIVERARECPGHDFLAVELSAAVVRVLAVRCGRANLTNLRVVRMDARPLVNLMLPADSVRAFHIYFPDPWPKERHTKHRLFTPGFAASLLRALEPDGIAFVATDVRERAEEIFPTLAAAGFVHTAEVPPGATRTGFARKYAAAGKPVYAASFRAIERSRRD
ncbi:MAG: tRNA (guanine(46)-N(7))-methyltransferase TrmB [Candidatus Binataceae bacterium]